MEKKEIEITKISEKDQIIETESSKITAESNRSLQYDKPGGDISLFMISDENHLKPPETGSFKNSLVSLESEIFSLNFETGDLVEIRQREDISETFGSQRVFKKTSSNSVLTLYLPSRQIVSCGLQPSVLRGILYVDPKAIQDHRVFAQLTLTFRYGREDEEVMGLRFCNEAIMSLYQIYPTGTEDFKSLSPLQDALIKRLGAGAYPFTLNLSPQSPPSVQLVPAKRYYGAPIGTSYDVRCFIADKIDEKFQRKAIVKMGVRVIHKTDVFSTDFATNQLAQTPQKNIFSSNPLPLSPNSNAEIIQNFPHQNHLLSSEAQNCLSPPCLAQKSQQNTEKKNSAAEIPKKNSDLNLKSEKNSLCDSKNQCGKNKKQERVDSFPKIRLSPKTFRFTGRFGRSKSEAEKTTGDFSCNYSKSFQEILDLSKVNLESSGPQGTVDKPFLLQEGRVCLHASLNKCWYTHGENVIVTIDIKNESKKTVRKTRVCAIQHVDVCMFNNGKFKNVVADSDNNSSEQITVGPGRNLTSTITLTPKRGPTKNWIALEDSLQRCTEPEEITGDIAASAVRKSSINPCVSPSSTLSDQDRNVFAIYVSYYVKVKLTLSGMGGELSLKLPFSIVHTGLDFPQDQKNKLETTLLYKDQSSQNVKICNKNEKTSETPSTNISVHDVKQREQTNTAERKIMNKNSVEDDISLQSSNLHKRRLTRSNIVVADENFEDKNDSVFSEIKNGSGKIKVFAGDIEIHAQQDEQLDQE